MAQVFGVIMLFVLFTGCASNSTRKSTYNSPQQEKAEGAKEDHSWHQAAQGNTR